MLMVLVMLLAVSAASVDHNDAFGKWRLPRRNAHLKLPFRFLFLMSCSEPIVKKKKKLLKGGGKKMRNKIKEKGAKHWHR